MSEPQLLAGAAARPITPDLERGPVFLAGFQRNRRATAVESPLWVRALGLRLHERIAVVVACDLIGLSYPDVLDIRTRLAALDIDATALIIACTHTHSAPDTLGLWGPAPDTSGLDPRYLANVKQIIADTAAEALTFSCPAQARGATTRLMDFVANYRTPEIVDDEVAALQFVKPDGETIATVLNLACHPEVLPGASALVSPDYAGAACRAVEAAIGGVALHISGALGGMLAPSIADRDLGGMRRMGQAYADAALAALASAPLGSVTRLELRRSRLALPQHNPFFEQAQRSAILRRRTAADGMLMSECSYLDLGMAQIAGVPGELLPELGFELKRAMRGPVRMVAGLADDELGYILPEHVFVEPTDYADPGKQYEESMSLGAQTGPLVMRAALDLIASGRRG
jgi:hypothetical protein